MRAEFIPSGKTHPAPLLYYAYTLRLESHSEKHLNIC